MPTALGMPAVAPYPLLHNGLLLPVWCLLIFMTARSARAEYVFSIPALLVLGEASYGIYILQQPIATIFRRGASLALSMHIGTNFPSAFLLTGYVLFLCGVSVLCFWRIEVPIRSFVNRTIRARAGRH